MLFDARTGFVYMSAMSVVMALAIWIVLRGQRTSSVWYWCGGGLAVAAGSMLMALRDVLPPIAYELGNLCIFVAFAAKVQSLRLEAGQSASWHRFGGRIAAVSRLFTFCCVLPPDVAQFPVRNCQFHPDECLADQVGVATLARATDF
ncbi:hypothetical protein [Chromatium okenii]|uniref:hypothetical protein n=1 Tax=Chromatium okenii TaxID=61644 RepID=UPI001558D6CD|nr:hypothetical protein [Chromatium okenii]